ncbi:S-layer homology domain-containing protein [Paenibacillus sp. MBLB4367]|uniref:S-layer homology domain-containing protein n=1 Tax=Paenibacillus sp. MBLB4367 TaxID=3384767 RepID=UPI003907F9A9
MYHTIWRKRIALMLAIALVATLFGPMRNRAGADAAPPEISTPSVNNAVISIFITPSVKDDGSYQPEDFAVKVNGQAVNVVSTSPFIDSDGFISFMFLFLERSLVKEETVTVAYINTNNPLKDEFGNALSQGVVPVNNMTPGKFGAPPSLSMPGKVKYKFRANAPIVSFSPTGQANRIQFTFPSEAGNDAWTEGNSIIHTKSDYVIINNTDSTVLRPHILFNNPGMVMVDLILKPGDYMEEGKSYTLAMSDTAGGNEVRLPLNPTSSAQAMITLFLDDQSGFSIIDDYAFRNVQLVASGNMPPSPKQNLSAVLSLGDPEVTYRADQLATDANEDNLTLSNPRSSNTNIVLATLDKGKLLIKPVHAGTAQVSVDVSDDFDDATIDITVEVIAQKTDTLSPSGISIINNENGNDYVIISSVQSGSTVKVYDASGHVIALNTQGMNGSMTVPVIGGISDNKVYVTLTELNKTESEKAEVTVAPVVDKQSLSYAVGQAQRRYDLATEGDANGQYAVGSKAAMQSAIDAANAVISSSTVNQASVDAALIALNEAVAVFDAAMVRVDRSALEDAVYAARDLHNGAVEGLGSGQYAPGSKAVLQGVIYQAFAVLDTALVTQSQVDTALAALNAAVAAFEASKVGVDKTQLAMAITAAQAKHDAATEGAADGQYAPGSRAALQVAINAAAGVNANVSATQTQVDAGLAALNAAVAAFDGARVSVNKAQLAAAIMAAQAKHDAATEGAADGQYAPGSKAALQVAINAAASIRADERATQLQVDAGLAALNVAVAAFEASKVGVNKAQLVAAIGSAQAKHDAATEGAADGQYAPGSKAALQSVINAAAGVNANLSATQTQVDAALAALNAASATFDGARVSVNKAQLAAAIMAAQAKHDTATEGAADGQYAPGSKAALQVAINAAAGVNANVLATQTQVDAALAALNAASATFDGARVSVNKAQLTAAITAAQAKHDAATEGAADGQYAPGSKAALQSAIDTAAGVRADERATQLQVDAGLAALNAAVAAFEASKVGVNKAQLTAAITAAQAKHDAATEGAADGQYAPGSKAALQVAINTAASVRVDERATQLQVDAGLAALNAAVAAFEASKVGVNKAQLTAAITAAQAKHDAATEGAADGQYAPGSKAALQVAINAAASVRADERATQLQVDAGLAALNAAVAAFEASKVGVNKAQLAAAIGAAQAKHDAAVEGAATGQYAPGSKAALQSAINAAAGVNANLSATQTQVDAALAALNAASATFDGARVSVNKAQLAAAITVAQAKHDAATEGAADGQYTLGSKAALQSAINTAASVRADERATQLQVDAGLAALNAAVAAFEASKVGVNKAQLAAAIGAAQAKHDAAVEGAATGQYAPGSKAALQSAINTAAGVNANVSATQSQVDAALSALNAAVAAFEASKVGVNKAQLAAAIGAAQAKHDAAVEGAATGQYAPGSKAALQSAINTAAGVNANVSATQSQVDGALSVLNAAVAAFEASKVSVNKTQLTGAIMAAQAKYDAATEGAAAGQYAPGSKAALQVAIDTAKAIEGEHLATQMKVDEAINALKLAVIKFEDWKISNEGGGNGNGNGSSGGSVSLPQQDAINIDIVSKETVVGTVALKRSKDVAGRSISAIEMGKELVAGLIGRLKSIGSNVFSLTVTEGSNASDAFILTISPEAADLWSGSGLSARLMVNGVGMDISAELLQGGHQVKTKIEPNKGQSDIDSVQKRAQDNAIVRQAAGNGDLRIIGLPVTIETNMRQLPVSLFLPLANNRIAGEQLEDTGIYVEHADGTQQLIRGTFLPGLSAWGLPGIQFDATGFSLVTVVQIDGWKKFRDASQIEQPARGYVSGYPDGNFKPDDNMTRAELAALLAKAVHRDGTQTTGKFDDLPDSHWAFAAIGRVASMGLMTGYPDGGFRPDAPVTRAEMAVIAAKLTVGKESARQISFPDITGHWAENAILAATVAGYLNGYEDGTFRPEKRLSRAEAVVIINKMLNIAPDKKGKAGYLDVPQSHWAFGDIQAASSTR